MLDSRDRTGIFGRSLNSTGRIFLKQTKQQRQQFIVIGITETGL